LVVLALVSWALYTIGSRWMMEGLSPLTVNWTTLLISIVFQIPLLWIDPQVLEAGAGSIPLSGWAALVYVIVFATALGQQAWLYGVSGIGPSRAGIFTNLIPVSALLLSFVDSRGIVGPDQNAGHRIRPGRGLVGQPLFRDIGGLLNPCPHGMMIFGTAQGPSPTMTPSLRMSRGSQAVGAG